jgi:hypothetical protein
MIIIKISKILKNPEVRRIPEKLQNSRTFLENLEDLATLIITDSSELKR